MREKEYSEWMGKQGFDVLRHANCCKIAFNGGWESRQTEVDELQKENAALVHVIKSRDIQLENEKHEYDELMNKLVDSGMKNKELQKRVDAVFMVLGQLNTLDDEAHKRWKREACLFSQGESNAYEHAVRLLGQALKGEHA